MGKRRRFTGLYFIVLSILMVGLFVLDILYGSVSISLADIVNAFISNGTSPDSTSAIIFNFRLPKALVAVLVGAALSVSGLQMQTVFRNPLADPYVLGISSGAGLGVALFLLGFSGVSFFAFSSTLLDMGLVSAAFLGSAIVLMLVLAVSIRVRDIMSVLIFGVMIGSAASAMVSLLQYFSTATSLKTYVVWTMGSLGGVSSSQLTTMAIVVGVGLILSLFSIKSLNALLLGDAYAQSLGLNVKRTRNRLFFITALLTGTVTAFCGPIGFIGIAVPHVARMLFREANHRILLPASILIGANAMLLCDMLSQLPAKDSVLPINTLTALLGIPIIIWIVLSNKRASI